MLVAQDAARPIHIAGSKEAVGRKFSWRVGRYIIASLRRINELLGRVVASMLVRRSSRGFIAVIMISMLFGGRCRLLLRHWWLRRRRLGRGRLGSWRLWRPMAFVLRERRSCYAKG